MYGTSGITWMKSDMKNGRMKGHASVMVMVSWQSVSAPNIVIASGFDVMCG